MKAKRWGLRRDLHIYVHGFYSFVMYILFQLPKWKTDHLVYYLSKKIAWSINSSGYLLRVIFKIKKLDIYKSFYISVHCFYSFVLFLVPQVLLMWEERGFCVDWVLFHISLCLQCAFVLTLLFLSPCLQVLKDNSLWVEKIIETKICKRCFSRICSRAIITCWKLPTKPRRKVSWESYEKMTSRRNPAPKPPMLHLETTKIQTSDPKRNATTATPSTKSKKWKRKSCVFS